MFSSSQQATFFRSLYLCLLCKSSNQEEEYRTALRHKQIYKARDASDNSIFFHVPCQLCHFNLPAVRLFYWFAFSSHDFISIPWAVCSFSLIRTFRGFWLRWCFCAVPVQVSFYLFSRALVHTFSFRGRLSDLSARSLPGLDQPKLNVTAKPSQSSNRT